MSVAIAIVGLAFLILIHEAGHFFVARGVGMRPRRFYIFFPPALVKRVRNGIEYGIGAIPLGGYVKIPGMHRPAAADLEAHLERAVAEAPWLDDDVERVKRALDGGQLADARADLADLRAATSRADLSEAARKSAERGLTDLDDALSADAYWRAPAWKKIAVIVAGPGTNLVFAVGLLAVVFALGVAVTTRVEEVERGSPAERAGLRAGDEIVAVDGEEVTPVLTDGVPARIGATEGRPVTITVERDGRRLALEPARARLRDGAYRLGFRLRSDERSFGSAESLELALREAWAVTEATGSALGRIVTGAGRDEVSSPVGIVEGSSRAFEIDYRVYLRILALISLSLAILNLLPLLPLDGGHIAFSVIEAVRGRAIPRIAYERVSAIGIVLVLMLFFIGLSNDVSRLNGG
ncbi:MAG: site-2 protease family protein [Actinomycetota bacterium]|nr:site-2 protease family protein [Actinomycetota bacterium]